MTHRPAGKGCTYLTFCYQVVLLPTVLLPTVLLPTVLLPIVLLLVVFCYALYAVCLSLLITLKTLVPFLLWHTGRRPVPPGFATVLRCPVFWCVPTASCYICVLLPTVLLPTVLLPTVLLRTVLLPTALLPAVLLPAVLCWNRYMSILRSTKY
jgi:hypothetical protein